MADLTLDEQERQLLEQTRRGHANLKFSPALEARFFEERFRFMQKHWGVLVVMFSAAVFQLVYGIHDFLTLPKSVFWEIFLLRAVAISAAVGSCLYFRRRKSPARKAYSVFGAAYLVCGVCVVLLTYLGQFRDYTMPYEGLLLLLLFGYCVINLPFRTVTLYGWLLFGLFMTLGVVFEIDREKLGYQLLYLACVNVIGSTGTYLQEHAHRTGWLNLKLLNISRRRTEREAEQRLHFLTTVGHDLRQPLNAMGLYSQYLQEKAEEGEVKRISEQLNASVEQLGRMMHSLLEYNRLTINGGIQVAKQTIALAPLVERLIAELKDPSGVATVQLSVICPDVYVETDPVLLERLVRNLLTNALRHANASSIWIKVTQQQQVCVLEVGDNGVGISEGDQEHVFDEFAQLNNPGRNSEQGLGLGLSIVRQLAEVMGHALRLKSARGEGARFQITLPLKSAPASTVLLPTQSAPVSNRGVLLLEDDHASREAMSALLERWGFSVKACADVSSALSVTDQFAPDLFISDYRLADHCDGLAAIALVREKIGSELPALLVTADADIHLNARCQEQGVTLLAKPLLPVKLRKALAVALKQPSAA